MHGNSVQKYGEYGQLDCRIYSSLVAAGLLCKVGSAISYTFQEISRQRALRPGRFMALNDLANSKIVIKMYFIFSQSFSSCLNDVEVTHI